MPKPAFAGKYAACLGVGFKAGMEYRANILISIAGAIAPVAIQTALWVVLYGQDPAASMFGFSFAQMTAYTVVAQIVSRLVRTSFEYEMNADIKSGSLDRFLVKPVGYFGYRLFSFMGDKLVQTIAMGALLAAAVAVLSMVLGLTVTPASVALFVLGLAAAFVLNFLIFWCVGLTGFWLTEIGYLFEAVRIVIIALSGGIFPLSVFGRGGERVLSYLPFRFTIQFPTELLAGRVAAADLLPSFALAGFWMIALVALGQLAWSRGLRRFAAVGS
jgi:ABC-2 type transport system permease protein